MMKTVVEGLRQMMYNICPWSRNASYKKEYQENSLLSQPCIALSLEAHTILSNNPAEVFRANISDAGKRNTQIYHFGQSQLKLRRRSGPRTLTWVEWENHNNLMPPQQGQPATKLSVEGFGSVIITIGLLAEILNNTPEVEDQLRLKDSCIEGALQVSEQFRQLVDNGTIPTY
ncbi:hypothetical protein BDV41DRAFT_536860 [Aspergillus transmontanensis]|uniref:Uncharacterized protein n=1 Tax=Aspergillus transmontanensis TaxID=1034304 RepID=A0A5N6VYG5_9EURO|nr:hypothetical protein BDV41DRAFT_536860 [Aspergillus transmontanensis]